MLQERLGLPSLHGSGLFLLVLLIDTLGSGLYAPVSLLYFHVAVGLPLPAVGLTLSLVAALALPAAPLTGALVDRFGARQVVIAAQILQGAGFLGYLGVGGIPALAVAAALATVGQRMFFAAYFTLVADLAAAAERDRWYGLAGAARSLGLAVGSLLSGALVATGGVASYRLVVLLNGLSYLLAGVLLLRVRSGDHAAAEPGGYRAVLADRPFLALTVVNSGFAVCSMLLGLGLPVYAREALAAPDGLPGVIFAANTALLATIPTLVVRLLEPYRRTRILLAAGALWSGWCVLLAVAGVVPRWLLVPYLLAATVPYTAAELIHAPTSNALAAAASPPSLRGRYLAAFQLSWQAAGIVAPGLFTLLFAVRPTAPWIAAAVLGMAAACGVVGLEMRLPTGAVRRATSPS